jgi:hypothetical protein
MKTMKFLLVAAALGGLAVAGCSSNSSCADGGACGGGTGLGGSSGAGGSGGPVYYGLTTGTCLFTVVSQSPGAVDGCDIGPEGAIGHSYPVVYDMTAGTVTAGTDGSLGTGSIAANMATLMRVGNTSADTMPSCTWHQTDTSSLQMTGTNMFTISVTETESGFAAACSAPPAGGSCTSTWTWKMAIVDDATVNHPPACGGP